MTHDQRLRGPRLYAAGLLGVVAVVFGVAAIAVAAEAGGASDPPARSDASISSPDAPAPDDEPDGDAESRPGGDRSATADDDAGSSDAEQAPVPPPVAVTVPSVDIDADLEPVGVDEDRRLVVPEPDLAGWFEGRAVPGQIGPAVLVGHVDSRVGPAVFHGLERVEVDDQVEVVDEEGIARVFEVERVQVVAKSEFPTAEVYDPVDRAELRLITCGGPFDHDAGSYRDNVIVYAAAVD